MFKLHLVYCVVLLNLSFNVLFSSQANVIRDFDVHKIKQCGDEKNFPVHFTLKGIVSNKNMITLDGFFDITEDINEPIELDIDVNRCHMDKTGCEHFERVMINDICRKMGSDGTFAEHFVKGIHPPLNCPIKKGIYQFNNGTIDMGLLSHIPLHGYHWQAITKFQTETKPPRGLFCVEEDVTIVHVDD